MNNGYKCTLSFLLYNSRSFGKANMGSPIGKLGYLLTATYLMIVHSKQAASVSNTQIRNNLPGPVEDGSVMKKCILHFNLSIYPYFYPYPSPPRAISPSRPSSLQPNPRKHVQRKESTSTSNKRPSLCRHHTPYPWQGGR